MSQEQIPYYAVTAPYDIAYRKDSPKHPAGPHAHNATELYLTLTDLPDVLIDNTVSEVSAGSLILIPPFCVHQLYHKAGVVYERYILSIRPEWLEQIFFSDHAVFRYPGIGEKPLILPLDNPSLCLLLKAFQDALHTDYGTDIDSIIKLFRILEQINACLTRFLPAERPQQNISDSQKHINKMISYINEHLNEKLRLSDLAEHFYLNADYLSRLFKEHTHTSVGRYIALQKITKAQMMLKNGSSVTQIQEALGYSSYAHFVKTFKKLTGMTPGQYRNEGN